MPKILPILLLLAITTVVPTTAQAWQDAYPGVRYLAEDRPGPVRVRAVEVDLCAPGVSLRGTASGEAGQTTSAFGNQVGAQVAVNADFFSWPANPIGLAMGAGDRWSDDTVDWGFIGFGNSDVLLSPPGNHVHPPPQWMTDAVGGNIMVLTGGAVTDDAGSFCTTRHPRTVAGLSADRTTLYLAVVDGRSTSSIGMTCAELGHLMADLGAQDALNLDGGGSTTMWRSGVGVVNVPSDDYERSVANHLAVHATGSGPAVSCPNYDVAIDANFLGLSPIHTDGDGQEHPDVFPGDRFEAEILVSNHSPGIIRDVWAGYWFEHPYLEGLDYTIYTDHPHYDKQTWSVNDANDAPENPEAGALGQDGAFNLYGFSPGETKRIVIEMEAIQSSIGRVDHPDIRTWVRQIENIYGIQEEFWDEPGELNRVGQNLRAWDELDVLSRDHWHFAGPTSDHIEGWRTCEGESDGLNVDLDARALVATDDLCLRSPDWTGVDAERFDQLVLNFSAGQVDRSVAIAWDGASSDELQYSLNGDSSVVLALADDGEWRSDIDELRLSFDGADQVGLGDIYFQSSADQTTSTPYASFVDASPLTPGESTNDPGGDDDGADENGTHGGSSGTQRATTSSCTTTPSAPPAGFLLLAILAGLVALRYR